MTPSEAFDKQSLINIEFNQRLEALEKLHPELCDDEAAFDLWWLKFGAPGGDYSGSKSVWLAARRK